MLSELVEAVLREVRDDILDLAARKSRNLSPWFEENDARLRVVANMIERVASASRGASASLVAEQTLATMRRVITARLPNEAAWFDRNQGILSRITEGSVSDSAKRCVNRRSSFPPSMSRTIISRRKLGRLLLSNAAKRSSRYSRPELD